MRLEDTNPSNEKVEFEEAIKQDVHDLGVEFVGEIRYSSDLFDYFIEKAEDLIKRGLAYCDNTDKETM